MAPGEHRFRFRIKCAQQLAFPAIPDAGPDGADVNDRQDQQQLQPFRALHNSGEIQDGLEVVEIAHLRRLAHQQMMADKPGRCFGFFRREAKARAKGRARCAPRLWSDPLRGPLRYRAEALPHRGSGGS